MVQKLAHVGICVKSIDAMVELLEKTIGVNSVSRVEMPERNQVSAYVSIGEKRDCLEIMEPIGEEGTVAAFLAKRGEGIHHLSLKVDSVEEAAAAFEAAGCRIIGRGKGVAFVHPKSAFGVLFELVDDSYE